MIRTVHQLRKVDAFDDLSENNLKLLLYYASEVLPPPLLHYFKKMCCRLVSGQAELSLLLRKVHTCVPKIWYILSLLLGHFLYKLKPWLDCWWRSFSIVYIES